MLQINEQGEVKHSNTRPHFTVQKQSRKQLVEAFNNVLSTMTHTQRVKVQTETEALWIFINTSF